MSSVHFKVHDETSAEGKSPKFLHISQIDKLFSTPTQPRRSVSPYIGTRSAHPPQRRPSARRYRPADSEFYFPNYSELAISAKDFVDKQRQQEIKKNEELNSRLFPSINQPRSLMAKRSRVSQMFPRKPSPSPAYNCLNSFQEVSLENSEDTIFDSVVLFDNTSEQSDIVWRYISGREESFENKEIYREWVQGLTKEERGPQLYHKTINVYGWHPRILSKQKLENDMEKLYGNGANRRLKPGEESAILENIRLILEKCESCPDFLQYSVHNAVRKILKKANLEELLAYPICVKQTELHWRIMATRFRCSGKPYLETKKFEKVLGSSQCKSHFLNLRHTDNLLVQYLMKHSWQKEVNF